MNVVNVRTREVYSVLTNGEQRTISLSLKGRFGIAIQNHGAAFDFSNTSLQLLSFQRGAPITRFFSSNASMALIEDDDDNIWPAFMNKIQHAYFQGRWHTKMLQHFIGNAPELLFLCMTYIQCEDLPTAIMQIQSKALFELTVHVGPKQEFDIVNAIASTGGSIGFRLKRLILVFYLPIKRDIVEQFQEKLLPALHQDAKIILLFGGETDTFCVEMLADCGYVYAGNVRMAGNDLVNDNTSIKIYENYKCYQNIVEGRKFKIGTLLGEHPPVEQFQGFEDSKEIYIFSDSIPLQTNLADPEWPHTIPHRIRGADYRRKLEMVEYGTIQQYKTGTMKCCNPKQSTPETSESLFEIIGWFGTQVQSVIYHEESTEYFTTDGFYIKLTSMQHEAEFYENMVCTKRIVFQCQSHRRLSVVVKNLDHFLRRTNHIEFCGDWDMKVLQSIASMLNPFEKLTMMRICFQRTQPIREFFNFIHDDVKESLRAFHIDTRDSPVDHSIGSIFNGIRQNLRNMHEFVALANNWDQPGFKCGFSKFLSDMPGLVEAFGTITIVVTKSKLPLSDLSEHGFAYAPNAAIVYPPFQRWQQLRYKDADKLLMQFYKFLDNRHIYIILPWQHELARHINRDPSRVGIWSCPSKNY